MIHSHRTARKDVLNARSHKVSNKVLIRRLLDSYGLSCVEKHLVYSYLHKQKLDFHRSPLLSSYLKDFEPIPDLLFSSTALAMNSINSLENCLEIIIPMHDRKFNGAFFTPEYIVNFIIRELSPRDSDVILDPSCGSGAFLIGLTRYYRQQFRKPVRDTVRQNVVGADILDYNIERAKIIISIFGLENNEILELDDFNIYTRDSLRFSWQQKFDKILGNPPYVKFQDLTDDTRAFLSKKWDTVRGGTFNLYFAFFELGYELLNTHGTLGYITPNNFFTSLSGEALRKYFQQKACVARIVDFSHRKVFDAQTYTAITFINKNRNAAITYDRIEGNQKPEDFIHTVNGSPNFLKNLNVKKWRLLKTSEQENIHRIENIGRPLGKLFDICVGIATLKDEVFFIDGVKSKDGTYTKTTSNGSFRIEREVTKEVFKISDFKSQTELSSNTRRIICPYSIHNRIATVIPESQFREQFPNCYDYLLSEKELLLNRDKGKKTFDPFFAWGRTQGLAKSGSKLLTPTFSQFPRFLYTENQEAFFTNGYGIFKKEGKNESSLFGLESILLADNLALLQRVLNSSVMHYYITKTSVSIDGGYPCYQKNFIEKFSIPNFTANDLKVVEALSEEELDEFLIRKYQLNLLPGNLDL